MHRFNSTTNVCSAIALATMLFGCATTSADEGMSVREQLEVGVDVSLARADATVDFTVRVNQGGVWAETPVSLPLRTGRVVLSSNAAGNLVLEAIDLVLDDITATTPTATLRFSDVRVQLVGVAVCDETRWAADADSASGDCAAPLMLSWALNLDTTSYPLRSEQLPAIAWYAEAYRTGLDLAVEISGSVDGVFWSWADLVEFSNLRINGSGTVE